MAHCSGRCPRFDLLPAGTRPIITNAPPIFSPPRKTQGIPLTPAAPAWHRSSRLRALLFFLAALLGVTGYLLWRNWANEGHFFGPADAPQETSLDPEVASRPGVAEIHKLGGRIEIDPTDAEKPITKVYFTSTDVTDAGLAILKPWKKLRIVDLSGAKISDAGLMNLHDLPALETLYLSFTPIRGVGLRALGKLRRLETLDLSKTQVSDDALANLQGFESLQVLSMIEDAVTDEGLKHLAALKNLRRLDLTGAQITDAGLVHLKGLTRLEHLNLHGTYVTAAGVAGLRKAIPGLTVSTSE